MLARRFMLVCLLAALFGVALSMLVEENARSRRLNASGLATCSEGSWRCGAWS